MLTRRCNMTCGHCSVASGPGVTGNEPGETELLDVIGQAAAAGVSSVLLTGGEPMLRERTVLRLLEECQRLGLKTVMTTNGFWGRRLRDARRRVRDLSRAGLTALTVSYDRYHAEFQGHEPALNIGKAAGELGVPLNFNVTRQADEEELERIVAPFAKAPNARLRLYDVQPVGRAAGLPAESLREGTDGFCSAADFPAVTDDLRLTTCNGPSYFASSDSPLVLGSLRTTPLARLLERHRQDPILDTIRAFGPSRLRDELRQVAGYAFPFRDRYHGICDLCCHITSNPEAVAVLRTRLTEPRLVAERAAQRRILTAVRDAGILTRGYVNSIGAGRIFLRAAWRREKRWTRETEQILGRADVDWRRQADYVSACGLARPLLGALDDPRAARWTPRFFVDRIRTRALDDGLRELVQREAIRRLEAALEDVGGRGVLLNGAAMVALGEEGGRPGRAIGAIDVLVETSLAPALRTRLLANGFDRSPQAPRGARHHPGALSFLGVRVELRTAIMPAGWGLPEQELLAHARPLDGATLATLAPEGLLLHTAMESTAHLHAFGLETAWDLLWILDRFPSIDVDRVVAWANASRIPRAFWTPVRLLARELEVEATELVERGPDDARQRALDQIARGRLLSDVERPVDLHSISRSGHLLLLHDSWIRRLGCLGTLVAANARMRGISPGLRAARPRLREAFDNWRRYRSAIAGVPCEFGLDRATR
jgi:pyruvate-formate lyase-activating enzyme